MTDTISRNQGVGRARTTARTPEARFPTFLKREDSGAGYLRDAMDAIGSQRDSTASALYNTASALHEKVEKAAGAAHRTADTIQAAADYIREHDLDAVAGDIAGLIKRYPRQCLVAAAVAGFLVGRAVRKNH